MKKDKETGRKIIQNFWSDMSGDIIESIGILKYLLSIIFGKNKIVQSIYIDTIKNNEIIYRFRKDEMIVTVSKNILIITEQINNKQTPIIVKKWKKIPEQSIRLSQKGVEYRDSKENIWLYLKSLNQKSLSVENKLGERMYFVFK